MLEKQLLTLVAVIKKIQLKLKSNNISIEELNKLVKDIQKELNNKTKPKELEDFSNKLNEFKTQLQDNREKFNVSSVSYKENVKQLSTSLQIGLNDIQSKLNKFITKEDINKLENDIDIKIKSIKIEKPEENKQIEVGKVYTIDPGNDAKVEITETKDKYKIDFYIPRGVSGRGQPGKGVPTGGTTNQVLAKNSNDDYDTKWVTGGGGGGTTDHAELTNLEYANSGHTGFQPAGDYALSSDIPTKTSELTNDSGFITEQYVLPTASTTVLGGVKIDGTTININNGVISAVTGGGGDVTGPTGATADNIAIYNGATGKIIKDGGKKVTDLVPYTGATSDVNLGEYSISNLQSIQFDLTNTQTPAEGKLYWNKDDVTLNLGLANGSVLQIGQETVIRCRNDETTDILNGEVVYISGSTSDFPKIKRANATNYSESFVLGIATQTIHEFGYVTLTGTVRDINTNGLTEGGVIWLGTTDGTFTQTRPTAPNMSVFLGYVIRAHATEGSAAIRPVVVPRLSGLSDVNATSLDTNGQIPVWSETNQYFDFSKNINNYRMYSGFENRTDSTLSINSGTGVFTLAPASTSFNVWTNGTGKHIISAPQTVTITADQTITYVYIDSAGDLQKSTNAWDLNSGANAPCSIIFKDGTNYTLTDERHSYERNKNWHNWAHTNIGAMYHTGLTGTFTNTTLSVTQGTIFDEDIGFDTGGTKTSATLWYRNATTGMRMIRNSTTPYSATLGVLNYDNGSGTLQPIGNSKYAVSWVYCSNDSTEPIYVVVGQAEYNTLNLARGATAPTINLSTAEWKLIYRLIYQNSGGTATYVEATDYRNVQTGVPTSPVSPTSHAALTDRDLASSHPATAISNTPSGTIAATTVQAALNELDSEKVAANAAIVSATKTKITYDTKGLVTSGVDATTADIADSTNKRYVTDAQLVVIGNTSNTNTGDETSSTIKTKLGITTLSGSNTGDQTSIVGISGTKAQFDTACSDGNFLYVGDVTQYTDELAQDAVGGILTDTATIDFTYTDATPSITADVKNASITYAKIQNVSATDKLLGRLSAGSGSVEEIACTSAGRALLDDADAAAQRTTLGLGTYALNNNDGWIAGTGTWSYSSADSPTFVISVNANMTSTIGVGMRIKLTQTTVKYFIVTAVGAYSGGATLITVYGGTDYTLANAAITSPYYSMMKCPIGFPLDALKWTVQTVANASVTNQAARTAKTLGTTQLPIGSWNINIKGYVWWDAGSSAVIFDGSFGLSTTQDAEASEVNRISYISQTATDGYFRSNAALMWRGYTVTSKTPIYQNMFCWTPNTTIPLLAIYTTLTATIEYL